MQIHLKVQLRLLLNEVSWKTTINGKGTTAVVEGGRRHLELAAKVGSLVYRVMLLHPRKLQE